MEPAPGGLSPAQKMAAGPSKLVQDWKAHYSDMPLSQFAAKIHDKFYKDMPFDQFAQKADLASAQLGPAKPTDRENDIGSRADNLLDMEGGGAFQAANIARDSMVPFSDEMAAGVGSLRGLANGNGVGEEYQREMEAIKLARERSANEHPVASGIGQGAGIALSVGGAGGAAAQAPSLASTIGASTALSAASGAGEGQGTDRLWNAGKGAAVGAVGGTVLGGGAAALQRLGSGAARAANPAVEAADRLGTQIPVVAASDNRATRLAGQAIGGTFVGAPIPNAMRAANEGLEGAVQRTAATVGQGGERAAVGREAAAGIREDIRPGGGSSQRVGGAYNNVDNLTAGGPNVGMPETTRIAQEIMGRRGNAALAGDGGAVNQIMEAATRPGGMTYGGLRDLRSNLREMTRTGNLPEGFSTNEADRLYTALTADLRGAADAAGPGALHAHDVANRYARLSARRSERLDKLIGTKTDEQVYDALAAAATSGGRGNVRLLQQARMAMGGNAWNDVVAASIQRLGQSAGGEFSPAHFVTQFGKLSPEGGRALFGNNPALHQALTDLHTVAERLRDTARLANHSNTGNVGSATAFGAGVLAAPLTTLGTALGGHLMARVLARPATVRAAAGWVRAMQSFGRGSSRTSALALQMATRSLAASIARELGQPSQAPQIEQRILSAQPGQ